MGDSRKAIAEDQDEHHDMMRIAGLDKDPNYNNIYVYSPEASIVRQAVHSKLPTKKIKKLIDKHRGWIHRRVKNPAYQILDKSEKSGVRSETFTYKVLINAKVLSEQDTLDLIRDLQAATAGELPEDLE